MVIAHCKGTRFIEFLKNNGCEVVSNKYWNEQNIIIMKKEEDTFPIIIEDTLYYFTVNKICDSLGIKKPSKSDELYNVSVEID